MNEAVRQIQKISREHRLVTTEESVFLKTSRKMFGKWFEHDFCAYRMECKKVGRYLLEQARKERLYVLLQGVVEDPDD